MEAKEQILDTWNIHSRIVLYRLDAIQREALAAVASGTSRTLTAKSALRRKIQQRLGSGPSHTVLARGHTFALA